VTKKNSTSLIYPVSRKAKQVDDYHGTLIEDPYRWLEDDCATEVEDWVKAQNKVTFDYLNNIPYREAIATRYSKLFDFPKMYSPIKVGAYFFYYKNEGLQNQAVIYRQKGLEGERNGGYYSFR